MKLSEENQFAPSQELKDHLAKFFKEEFAARQAQAMAKGGTLLEDEGYYCRKKTAEFTQNMNGVQEKLLDGFIAYMEKDEGSATILPIFKNISRLGQLNTEDILSKTLQQILEISDEEYLILYNTACEELNHQHYKIASDMFCLLLWLNPILYLPPLNLGLAESLQGHYEEAQQIYDFYITNLFNEIPQFYLYAADNGCMLGDFDKVNAYLDKAISLANEANDSESLAMAEQIRNKIPAK